MLVDVTVEQICLGITLRILIYEVHLVIFLTTVACN